MSKFLSYEDRMIIAQRLQENASFGAIGKELGKDRTTRPFQVLCKLKKLI